MTRYLYSPEAIADAAARSVSVTGVLRLLGIRVSGGSHAHLSRQMKKLGIDTSHFTGQAHNRGGTSHNRKTAEQFLVRLPADAIRTPGFRLRKAMLAVGIPELCNRCGIGCTWQQTPLILHVDHVNGDFLDNGRENLRFLCPNCHSQTPTYAGRNRPANGSPHRQEVIAYALAHPTMGAKAMSLALRGRATNAVDVGATTVLVILRGAGLNTSAARRAAAEAATGDDEDPGDPLN